MMVSPNQIDLNRAGGEGPKPLMICNVGPGRGLPGYLPGSSRRSHPIRPSLLLCSAALCWAATAAAQSGLSSGRTRPGRRGEPEFQLGILGSGTKANQERGVGFFAGLRLPINRWLFANVEAGHVYRATGSNASLVTPPPPPPTGPFVRTGTELTDRFPLVLPTGFFAARLSSQLSMGGGAKLRLQAGTRRRNASHAWLPTAGVAVQFPSRSTPVFVELEVARYQIGYQDVREEFLDGNLVTRTVTPSDLKPLRGPEIVIRVGLSFGPQQRGRRR